MFLLLLSVGVSLSGEAERDSPLLAPAECPHRPPVRGQLQQRPEELHPGLDLTRPHLVDPAEVEEGLQDGELQVERQFLRHEAHPPAGDAGGGVPGAGAQQ